MPLSMVDLMDKPSGCAACPYKEIGAGFTPDFVPRNPKVALLLEAAGEQEWIERAPLVGGTGKMTMRMFERVGWSRSDLLIANVIHCHPPDNRYPIGVMREQAEACCAQYFDYGNIDMVKGGLNAFRPDYFLFTIHPAACLRSWTLTKVLRASYQTTMGDLEKARRLCDSGVKLLLLMGDKAKSRIFPGQYPGGILRWRGHHGPLDWSQVKW